MKKLVAYMKSRAAFEGVEWKLTAAFLQQSFDQGIRTFFGVDIDEKGNLLSDVQQPDFFKKYHGKARTAVSVASANVRTSMTKKKKKPQKQPKMLSHDEKVMRLAHEILTKKIEPANLTIDEAIDVVTTVVKAIVIANTSEDDPEDRSGMIEWIQERFVDGLMAIDPNADASCPHAWLIPPQGCITEPVGIMWSGTHDEDSVQVMLGADLERFRTELSEMEKDDDAHVHVIEGVEGVAMIDPEWNGEETVKCGNPECGATHSAHLTVAENLFQQAKQRAEQRTASN